MDHMTPTDAEPRTRCRIDGPGRHTVKTTVTDAELARLRDRAGDLSTSGWLRGLVLDAIN